MENKQTAVEWLVEQIKSDQNQKALSANEWMQVIERAKEMEKEQIKDAHYEGQCNNHEGYPKFISEQYYNETYGKQTDRNASIKK